MIEFNAKFDEELKSLVIHNPYGYYVSLRRSPKFKHLDDYIF